MEFLPASFRDRSLAFLVALVAALLIVPGFASAAAVTASSLTATSSNVYVNSGFATTTRVTTGDQVRYQLTTSGTPLIAPQINIFSMGSTTMSGSGTNWFYSTTSVSIWTEGAVTFSLGIGGTAGDATTTVTHASLSGTNVTYDKTAPTLNSVSWSDVDGSTQFSATDTLTLTFSETMATSTLAAGNVDTRLALSGSHTFGTSPTVAWNTAGTVLTLTLGTSPTLATADTIDPTTAVDDAVGIDDATAAALTITDNVAPLDPGGLSYINFRSSISVSIASTGSSQIRYTSDGTTPTCSTGTAYSSAFTLTETTTIKAIGCDEASNASAVVTAIYTRNGGTGGGGGASGKAKASLDVPPSTNGCTAGNAFDTQTGKPCAMPANQNDGCTPGAVFNTRTGKSCAAPATPSGSALANASPNAAFNRNLTIGSQGDDVRALQVFLNTHGYVLASTGPGSSGNETSVFGGLTRSALIKYQQAKGISPAAGYFGPLTRAAVRAEL